MAQRDTKIVAEEAPPLADAVIVALLKTVGLFHATIPLTHFFVIKRVQDAVPTYFDFGFEAEDGRSWAQTLSFSSATDQDPEMTFSVGDRFSVSENTTIRAVRDAAAEAIRRYDPDEIQITWS